MSSEMGDTMEVHEGPFDALRRALFESLACSCNPEAFEVGPEGQRRYFEDRYCPLHGERASEINVFAAAIRDELQPIYHVTPGGFKWSKSTDALRDLVQLAKGQAAAISEYVAAIEFEADESAAEGDDCLWGPRSQAAKGRVNEAERRLRQIARGE